MTATLPPSPMTDSDALTAPAMPDQPAVPYAATETEAATRVRRSAAERLAEAQAEVERLQRIAEQEQARHAERAAAVDMARHNVLNLMDGFGPEDDAAPLRAAMTTFATAVRAAGRGV